MQGGHARLLPSVSTHGRGAAIRRAWPGLATAHSVPRAGPGAAPRGPPTPTCSRTAAAPILTDAESRAPLGRLRLLLTVQRGGIAALAEVGAARPMAVQAADHGGEEDLDPLGAPRRGPRLTSSSRVGRSRRWPGSMALRRARRHSPGTAGSRRAGRERTHCRRSQKTHPLIESREPGGLGGRWAPSQPQCLRGTVAGNVNSSAA